MRQVILAAAMALLAASVAPGARGVEDVYATFERSATLAEGAWDGYKVFIVDETQVSVDIRVSGDVDFYVFTPAQLDRYQDPNASSFPAVVTLEKAHRFQYNTSTCCRVFVIDNTARSPTGQTPDGPEYYTIEITYEAPTAPPTSFVLPAWVNWAYPAAVLSLILGTTAWLMTPPRRHRHASDQLKEFLK